MVITVEHNVELNVDWTGHCFGLTGLHLPITSFHLAGTIELGIEIDVPRG